MLEPPMFGGVASSSQACITARIANRKKPRNETNRTNQGELPASAMNSRTTPDVVIELTMICRRPIESERWPATGVAANPATCRPAITAPIQNGGEARLVGRKIGREV